MTSGPDEFVRFARLVAEDAGLAARLRPLADRAALVAAEGAARSFGFAAAEVEAAMAANRAGWLMHPTPLLAYPIRSAPSGGGTPALGPLPDDRASGSLLRGWTPFRAGWIDGTMAVDWCHLGDRRFTAPFFFETIAMGIGHPFNAAFQQRRPADELAILSPGLPPSGFVFHMARCGSTLVAQALASDPAAVVMSEAVPVRAMLQAPLTGAVAPARADAWLKGIIDALGRPRVPGDERYVVKFMAADVLDIGWITRLFPDVPWLFLMRDPLEILGSQMRMGGADTLPGHVPPGRLGLGADEIWTMPPERYQLHALAAYGRAALDALADAPGRGLVLDYRDLPEALWGRIPAHFGFVPSPEAADLMRAVAGRHAKAPGTPFAPDGEAKRREAAPWRHAAERITGDVMAALDAARRSAA